MLIREVGENRDGCLLTVGATMIAVTLKIYQSYIFIATFQIQLNLLCDLDDDRC